MPASTITTTPQATTVGPSNSAPDNNQGLTRLDVRRGMRYWILEGPVSSVNITLTGGAFQIGFALYLGCSNFVIGLIAAVPAFAGLLQLLASYFGERYGNRKQIVCWCSLVSRLLWLPMLLIPFVLPKPDWVGAFLVLTLLASAIGNIGPPLWMAWVTDLMPADARGRYFAKRNVVSGITGAVTSIVGGAFLDAATKRHVLAEPTAFAGIFGLAILFAFGSFTLGQLMPDKNERNVEGTPASGSSKVETALRFDGSARAHYLAPFADRNFRRVILYNAVFAFAMAISGQFLTVYQLSILKLNYTSFQVFSACSTVAMLISMPFWGYFADKYGNKPILIICSTLVVLVPIIWTMTYADGMAWLWRVGPGGHVTISYSNLDVVFVYVFGGLGWSGLGLTQNNLMLSISPSARRSAYVSAISAVSGIAGGVAPLVGAKILELSAGIAFPHVGLVRSNYHLLFVCSGVLRFLSLVLLFRISEAGSNSARHVWGHMRASNPFASYWRLQHLARAHTVQARVAAIAALGHLKSPVAADDLAALLSDAARPVREAAANALVEIGGTGDTPAVQPADVLASDDLSMSAGLAAVCRLAESAVESGDPQALDALLNALHRADITPFARRIILRAVGRIVLRDDSLYNLMTYDDFGRDDAVNRHLKAVSSPYAQLALAAFVDGDHVECLQQLAKIGGATGDVISRLIPRAASLGDAHAHDELLLAVLIVAKQSHDDRPARAA